MDIPCKKNIRQSASILKMVRRPFHVNTEFMEMTKH